MLMGHGAPGLLAWIPGLRCAHPLRPASPRRPPHGRVPADVMRVRQGSGVAQASGPNPMSFPSVNSC